MRTKPRELDAGITVRIPQLKLVELQKIADKSGTSVAGLVRICIDKLLNGGD